MPDECSLFGPLLTCVTPHDFLTHMPAPWLSKLLGWGRHVRPTLQVANAAVLSRFGRDPLSGKSSNAIGLGYSGVGHLRTFRLIKNFRCVLHMCALRDPPW